MKSWFGALAVAIGLSLTAGAALAAPVIWNVSGTLAGGGTLSGSFVYDADTGAFSAINITTTAGTLPGTTYTVLNPASNATRLVATTASGTAAGQPALALSFTPSLSGTAGVRTINNTEGDCNTGCTDFGTGTKRSVTGTATSAAAVAAVPTMAEWAMILFGTALAGGAALYIQRRRLAA